MLLLTNDSEWAARHHGSGTHLDKTYHVQVGAVAAEEMLEKLRRGIETEKGEVLRAKRAEAVRAGEKNSWIELVLDEGKNRQIRRIFDGLGVEVLRLIRVAIGGMQLGDLVEGCAPRVKPEEKRQIDRAIMSRDPQKLSWVAQCGRPRVAAAADKSGRCKAATPLSWLAFTSQLPVHWCRKGANLWEWVRSRCKS